MLAMGLVLAGCGDAPSEDAAAVRRVIAHAEEAAEARDTGRLLAMVSEDFDGPHGIGRKAHLRRLLQGLFMRHQGVHLYTRIREIEFPTPTRADVVVAVAMAGRPMESGNDARELSADVYRFELELERTDTGWQARRAAWERASPGELLP